MNRMFFYSLVQRRHAFFHRFLRFFDFIRSYSFSEFFDSLFEFILNFVVNFSSAAGNSHCFN